MHVVSFSHLLGAGGARFELEESMDIRSKLPQASCPESKRICGFVKGRQRKGLEFVP